MLIHLAAALGALGLGPRAELRLGSVVSKCVQPSAIICPCRPPRAATGEGEIRNVPNVMWRNLVRRDFGTNS